ncbi:MULTISPECIES: lipase family protein [Sorangium]|uniref:Fungal lipase-type domain-containing protein n=1 Tax=Sorangium cellulosum TaxID=56 RepID=A0A4P2R483_SORCE|nr:MULTISPECIES: lipase family protein [Sorangium]AUX37870.1 uncharacterized protein SOCE836_101060 [Sorangium cellulosum]WCQ97159.1 esterase/lipase [Sorangium sp. Soce836]
MEFGYYPDPRREAPGGPSRANESLDRLRRRLENIPAGEDPNVTVMALKAILCCNSEEVATRLAQLTPGAYDSTAASILAAASTWAYSDIDTFARMVKQWICPALFAGTWMRNEALILNPSVYMIQSDDFQTAILCFRGTPPTSLIDLLTDVSAKSDPFYTVGQVHGGFSRAVRALMSPIRRWLRLARSGKPINDRSAERHLDCCSEVDDEPVPDSPLKALYFTGHSLGGAMAVIAAAHIFTDESLRPYRNLIRGVYTFGQPMVSGKVFARYCEAAFGKMLFRHVYRWDAVPSLPPRTMGEYEHFGREYEATDTGWQYRDSVTKQSNIGSLRIALAGIAWVMDQLQGIREQPVVRDLALLLSRCVGNPPSLADHSPLNYVRTSQMARVGGEFSPR